VHEALDSYCALGYPHKVQFRLYEHKSAGGDPNKPDVPGKTVFFSLSCYMRNMPRYE